MPNYSKQGKITIALTEAQFIEGMERGPFCKPEHQAFLALLYHSGVRKSEALEALKEQFQVTEDVIYFDVLRKKRSSQTAPLPIGLQKPFAKSITNSISKTRRHHRVFSFSPKTAYNIVARVFYYPHHLRLTKITQLYEKGATTTQLKSWTGLTLNALDYYTGLVDIQELGNL